MSKDLCIFPDLALYIHPSIIFVEFHFNFLNMSVILYPNRFATDLLFGNLYLFPR